jgi:hypothetical protein
VQRLAVYYLLVELNIAPSYGVNGFTAVLLDAVDSSCSTRDAYFVLQLLSRGKVFSQEVGS